MATEYTPNYNLDLYTSTDKPNLRDQYNAAMGKIDTQLKANADGVTNVSASVVAATAAANEAKELAENAAPKNHASQTSEYGAASALSYGHVVLASVEQTAIEENGKATSPKAVYDFVNNGYAPKSHADGSTRYGGSTAKSFGHVLLVDSASSVSAATQSIAATPLCVDNKIEAFKKQFHAQTLLPQTTYQYDGGVGSCTLSVHFDPITNICVVQYHNINLNIQTGTSVHYDLYTLPVGYRPLNDCAQVCLFDLGTHSIVFNVLSNGACRLSITGSSDRYNVSQIMSACITFIAEQ